MVKKLFKHEVYALWRSMIPIWAILGGVSILGRFIQLFEQETVAYNIISGSAIFFYVVSLAACIVCPFVYAITRFHRNLFSGEGYLTFTLPVTAHQHILVKLAVAVMTQLVTLVAAALSVIIVTFGDLTVEIGKAIAYIFKLCVREWGAHLPLYMVEAGIGLIVLFAVETMLFYACICIGQQSKKNRILAAVGAYFGIYAIQQVIGTIALLVGAEIDWEPLWTWVAEHPFATVHIVLCGGIVLAALVGGLFYFISYRLISRRLNLE
ncbi:MAG: hypothetical protein IKL13_00660 [Clostridia bacterium]|nr:hypothetical protein [Clostridia bacterium]